MGSDRWPEPKKIILYLPRPLGDAIMAIPLLRRVRISFPQAYLYLLGRSNISSLLEGEDFFDDFLIYDGERGGLGRRMETGLSLIGKLKEQRIDWAILMPNSLSSALITYFAGVKRRIGYARNLRSPFLTDKVLSIKEGSRVKPCPMVDYYNALGDYLDLKEGSSDIGISISLKSQEKAGRILDNYAISKERPIVSITPGASFGPSKCWSEDYFATLIDLLIEKHDAQVLLLGGPGEEELVRRIIAKGKGGKKPLDLSNPPLSLDILKAIIYRSDLLITNDTGPFHIVAALKVPALVLVGPTDPIYSQYPRRNIAIIKADLPCIPCHKKACPKEGHPCMSLISPERVLKEAERFLGQ